MRTLAHQSRQDERSARTFSGPNVRLHRPRMVDAVGDGRRMDIGVRVFLDNAHL